MAMRRISCICQRNATPRHTHSHKYVDTTPRSLDVCARLLITLIEFIWHQMCFWLLMCVRCCKVLADLDRFGRLTRLWTRCRQGRNRDKNVRTRWPRTREWSAHTGHGDRNGLQANSCDCWHSPIMMIYMGSKAQQANAKDERMILLRVSDCGRFYYDHVWGVRGNE